MENWIPFADGEYLVERAFLLSPNDRAVDLADVVVEVNSDARGRHHLRGRGRLRNVLVVALLEDSDELDLVLDFGGDYKYRLVAPSIRGGKVFAADVKSALQFLPQHPWKPMTPAEYQELLARLHFIEERRPA